MNDEQQKRFILYLARQLKSYYRELLAYRVFAQLVKDAGFQDVEKLLEAARNSRAVQYQFDKNFEQFDELLPPSAEDYQDQALRELLGGWKPDGEPN